MPIKLKKILAIDSSDPFTKTSRKYFISIARKKDGVC